MRDTNQTRNELEALKNKPTQALRPFTGINSIAPEEVPDYSFLITSQSKMLMSELLANVDKGDTKDSPRLQTWKERSEDIASSKGQITIFDYVKSLEPNVAVYKQSRKTLSIVSIKDTSKLSIRNSTAIKFIDVILGEALKLQEEDGHITRGVIIPYNLLLDSGWYGDKRTAKRGLVKQYNESLKHIELIAVSAPKGKALTSKEITASLSDFEELDQATLFVRGNFKSPDYAVIYLNHSLDYSSLFEYYTRIPREALTLNGRAYSLLTSILSYARQKQRQIEEEGHFFISLKTIARDLGLPPLEGNENTGRTVIDPLETAIADVEALYNKLRIADGLEVPDIQLKTVGYYEESSHKEMIVNGRLRVDVHGETRAYHTQMSKKQSKEIAIAKAKSDKQQARVDKAKGEALAKLEVKDNKSNVTPKKEGTGAEG